jgi:hypothetical protein
VPSTKQKFLENLRKGTIYEFPKLIAEYVLKAGGFFEACNSIIAVVVSFWATLYKFIVQKRHESNLDKDPNPKSAKRLDPNISPIRKSGCLFLWPTNNGYR